MSALDHARIEGAFARISELKALVTKQEEELELKGEISNTDFLRLRKLKLVSASLLRLSLTITRAMQAQKQSMDLRPFSQEAIERIPSTERNLFMDLTLNENTLLQHLVENTYKELDDLEEALRVIRRHLQVL